MTRPLVLAFCLTFAAGASGAEIGRLFFTPAERAQLDVARTQKKAPPPPAAQVQAEETPPPQIVTYSGIVRRSDGRSMVWINDRLADEKEALGEFNLKGSVRPNGAVSLEVPRSGGRIDVKVGQSVELTSRRVAEGRKFLAPSHASMPEAKAASPESAAAGPASQKNTTTEANDKKRDPERKQEAVGTVTEKQTP
jgi:hypothetical protein